LPINEEEKSMASKLGTLIKEARVGAGLTQEKLAKRLAEG